MLWMNRHDLAETRLQRRTQRVVFLSIAYSARWDHRRNDGTCMLWTVIILFTVIECLVLRRSRILLHVISGTRLRAKCSLWPLFMWVVDMFLPVPCKPDRRKVGTKGALLNVICGATFRRKKQTEDIVSRSRVKADVHTGWDRVHVLRAVILLTVTEKERIGHRQVFPRSN